VQGRLDAVESRTGPLVPVVVARAEIAPGTELDERRARSLLAVREVPERFAPADALSEPAEARGLRVAARVAGGSYLTAGALEAAGGDEEEAASPRALRRGERALEVRVAGGAALEAAGGAEQVDVLVTTQTDEGPGRSYLALERVDLLDLRSLGGSGARGGGEGEDAASAVESADAVATLRVTLRQAVYLTAAQSFGKEVRLLARPPSDRRRAGHPAVAEGEL
jgi:pilus assembly protein CpaB